MKVISIEIIKGLSGKVCQHSDTSVVYNSVSGKMHTCKYCNPRTAPATEKQLAQQQKFKAQSLAITAWLNANKPSASNPLGTEAYRHAQALRKSMQFSNVRQVLFKYLDKDTNEINLPGSATSGSGSATNPGGGTGTNPGGGTTGGDHIEEL